MIENRLIWLFLFVSQFTFSQIKGVVKDSISGEPIPYVNIWVENEAIGTTSDIDGTFSIDSPLGKTLILSSIGYKKMKVLSKNNLIVQLPPDELSLNEVILSVKKNTKTLVLDNSANPPYFAYDSGPKIDAKFFPFDEKNKKFKFIKNVTFLSDCAIDSATVRLHLYKVSNEGMPGEELLLKPFIIKVKKGIKKYKINLYSYSIEFPKEGLFVAIEKLLIPSNKSVKEMGYSENGMLIKKTIYHPFVMYTRIETNDAYFFSGGKWNKILPQLPDKTISVNMPVITLVLSN